jgi:glyoxylase-like metal-dependent hydrolase (beta-lactamase superfamily II)
MKRLKWNLKWLVLSAVILAVIALLALSLFWRLSRHRFDQVEIVQSDVVQVRNNGTYIYGAKCGDRVLIFDGGMDERGDALDAMLDKLGAVRDQITDVFLTHGHWDHIALAPLCENARIHLGIGDAAMAADEKLQKPRAARWLSWLFPTTKVHITDPLVGRAEFNFG